MKKILAMLLALCMLLSMAACSTKQEQAPADNDASTAVETGTAKPQNTDPTEKYAEKIKLKVFLLSEDANRLALYNDYYSQRIGEAFPDYEVEFELPGTSYAEKLKVYNSSGELPDIYWGTSDLTIVSDNALDLTPYIEADGFADKYKTSGALIPYTDGKIYAISAGTDAYYSAGLWYNKDIFEAEGLEIPTSYEELVALCKTLVEKGYVPIAAYEWPFTNWIFQELATNDGPDAMIKLMRHEIGFNDPAFVEAARKIQELVSVGAFPADVATTTYEENVSMLETGKAAMLYHPLWALAGLNPELNLGYISLANYGQDLSLLNGWGQSFGGFMVSKHSENVEAAVAVAEWLCTQDAEYFNSVGNAVALDVGLDAPVMSEIVQAYYDAFNAPGVVVVPNFSMNYLSAAGQAEFSTNIGKLLTNQCTPEEFCAAMDAVYNQ